MGRKFWEYAARGELVPDEFTIKLWRQYIKGMEMVNQFHPDSEMLVLDGIPRNLEQAQLLQDTIEVVLCVHLHCTDLNKMVERLRRRALRENRFDDASDDVIQKRLIVYEKETRPVLAFYPKDRVVKVEATMSQIRVLSELIKIVVPLKEAHDRENDARSAASSKPQQAPSTVAAVVAASANQPA